MVLYDIFIILNVDRNLDVNHCDPKSDLNSCFRMRLLVYDLKTSLSRLSCPSMPTYRYICTDLVLVVHTESRLSKIFVHSSKPTRYGLSRPLICPSSMQFALGANIEWVDAWRALAKRRLDTISHFLSI